jgi:hypothetical protein
MLPPGIKKTRFVGLNKQFGGRIQGFRIFFDFIDDPVAKGGLPMIDISLAFA